MQLLERIMKNRNKLTEELKKDVTHKEKNTPKQQLSNDDEE